MTSRDEVKSTAFGGLWTREKLDILENYLDAYTTALKEQPFKLLYIDAFAGTGLIRLQSDDDDARKFVRGSAERASRIENKSFDRLIFVEKDPDRCVQLEKMCEMHPGRDIVIRNSEANVCLSSLHEDWTEWRGVLFLDPFATEVEWSTIETISGFNALDTWILFPISAIARMLPKSKKPDEISGGWVNRLTTVFGDESWRDVYREKSQGNLFESGEVEREPGINGLIGIYKEKLSALFGDRFLHQSRTLRNSRNSALFEFLFCVGNSKGIGPAKRIAKHLMRSM